MEMKAELTPPERPAKSAPCVRRKAAGVRTRAAVGIEAQEGGIVNRKLLRKQATNPGLRLKVHEIGNREGETPLEG